MCLRVVARLGAVHTERIIGDSHSGMQLPADMVDHMAGMRLSARVHDAHMLCSVSCASVPVCRLTSRRLSSVAQALPADMVGRHDRPRQRGAHP
jgi:hypothetical protein